MANWFVCQIKYNKQDEKGNVKKVTEAYLVDAILYSEAEERIYRELSGLIPNGEFVITDLRRSPLADIFHFEDSTTWYKCKITYNLADEATQKIKKVVEYVMVTAENIKIAYERLEDGLGAMIEPYTVVSITECAFMEVFGYEGDKNGQPKVLVAESQEN